MPADDLADWKRLDPLPQRPSICDAFVPPHGWTLLVRLESVGELLLWCRGCTDESAPVAPAAQHSLPWLRREVGLEWLGKQHVLPCWLCAAGDVHLVVDQHTPPHQCLVTGDDHTLQPFLAQVLLHPYHLVRHIHGLPAKEGVRQAGIPLSACGIEGEPHLVSGLVHKRTSWPAASISWRASTAPGIGANPCAKPGAQ